MADLQELFSRLKSSTLKQEENSLPHHPNTSYQPPAVSSPIFSPPVSTPNPTGSGIISPQPAGTPSQDAKAASLLSLLRFNGQTNPQSSPLAALQNVSTPHDSSARQLSGMAPGIFQVDNAKADTARNAASSIQNPQDFLLNLLKQPSKRPDATPSHLPAPQPQAANQQELVNNLAQVSAELDSSQVAAQPKEESPVRHFGSAKSRETTPFEMNTPIKSNGLFTYVNPFEQLSASTPKKGTPTPQTKAGNSSSSVDRVDTTPQPESTAAGPHVSSTAHTVKREVAEQSRQAGPKTGSRSPVPETWQAEEDVAQSTEVKVYNFPMRPFVSIQINAGIPPAAVRTENIMDISRLKKEFDQIDRSLATASQSHIVYAMSRPGGFRVIRQDSGRDKQVFKSHSERIFHVQIKPSSGADAFDSILAAGVNGSVFWTRVEFSEDDTFADENLEAKGFILPPLSAQEDNTSGSLVKTRSRMSSRHSDIFAISRGKFIHLIAPLNVTSAKYTDTKSRVVDTTKFFQEHSHKITTGKACKDFAFSEDDTVIASLDKAGRIRFWDIKDLSDAARISKKSSIELKTPVLTFTAGMASEKISPTSVMFLDKERPCNKGIALRYLLVGFKQNHVLQLWDLGLGKPVQELHFPHEKDSDAICSISYHPKTGIISLAHPTRNSIYFIHLSAPRYNIPTMDQAKYVSMIAEEDTALPKPESTAIMSGIREISFGSKGQLRSVDMLAAPASAGIEDDVTDATLSEPTLFELYAMHSTGVTCLSIKKADLGWDADNKVMHPNDAEKAGYITLGPIATTPAATSTSEESVPLPKVTPSVRTKVFSAAEPSHVAATTPSITSRSAKETIRTSIETTPQPSIERSRDRAPDSYAAAVARLASSTLPELVGPAVDHSTLHGPSATTLVDRSKNRLINGESSAASEDASRFSSVVSAGLDNLAKRIDEDRRLHDEAANKRQDAMLKLVSSTLTVNVEESLKQIVSSGLKEQVLPELKDKISTMLEPHFLHLDKTISGVVEQRLLRYEDTISKLVEQRHNETLATISQTIVSLQNTVAEREERFAKQRSQDADNIDRLANLVLGLSETIQGINASQHALHEQLLTSSKQKQGQAVRQESSANSATAGASVRSAEDQEVDEITALMTGGKFEEGTIRWLQSPRQAELFDRLFVRVNPQYLQKLSPLVKLSVSAAVSTSFDQNVDQRLEWMGTVLSTTDLQDAEIAQVAPEILKVLLTRIQNAYLSFAETNRKFSNLSGQIVDIRKLLG